MNFLVRFLTIFTVLNGVGILRIKKYRPGFTLLPSCSCIAKGEQESDGYLTFLCTNFSSIFQGRLVHVRFSILEWHVHGNHGNKIPQTLTRKRPQMGCGQSSPAVSDSTVPHGKKRRQSVVLPPPDIPLTLGSNVKFQPPPNSKIIVIIGKCTNHNSAHRLAACLPSY